MLIISLLFENERWFGTSNPRRLKAPRNQMFELKAIYAQMLASASSRVHVIAAAVEEATDTLVEHSELIVTFEQHIDGAMIYILLPEPITTKYLSLITEGTISMTITLFYTLKKASRSDLVWEWLIKRR